MLKKILFFTIPFLGLLVLFYTYTGYFAKAPVITEPTEEEIASVPGQSYSEVPPAEYEKNYFISKKAAGLETNPQEKAILLLNAASFLKKFTTDVDMIANEFKAIYADTALPEEERGLALLKISQQANGNNRYDLLDQFLTTEEQVLSNSTKNYLVNQQIFELISLAMVYASIKNYEVKNGLEFYADDLYEDVRNRIEQDLATLPTQNWLVSLVPDTAMHGAVLYALINESDYPYGVKNDDVIVAFDRALELNQEHTKNNATKDYIYLETINFLLKIGKTEEANVRVDAFLNQRPTNMIRTFFANGGLSNGRFEHIANNPDISAKLIESL